MKKFIIKSVLFTFPFYLSFFIYLFYVEPNLSGDLGNLGKIPFGKAYNEKMKKNHLEEIKIVEYKLGNTTKRRIMTIGDSFTPTSANSYVNYLAHYLNEPIVNLPRKGSSEQTALYLLNNGFFHQNGTQVVVVETVERHFVNNLIHLKFEELLTFEDVLDLNKKPMNEDKDLKAPKKNYLKELSSWYRLSFGYDNPVFKANLSDSLFSIRSNKLYFYKEDVLLPITISDCDIDIAKRNLRKLDSLFRLNNIHLIYMVASDKYDLYQEYIVDNPYPTVSTLEKFKEFEKESYFLNTQTILKPMLKDGIKDVYSVNDTHWSYIATEKVAKKLYRKITPILNE